MTAQWLSLALTADEAPRPEKQPRVFLVPQRVNYDSTVDPSSTTVEMQHREPRLT